MADVKKIATRDSYGNALVELAAAHDDVVVFDADLAGATKTGTLKKAYPERHYNAGIAECNMVCLAAGAASSDGGECGHGFPPGTHGDPRRTICRRH